MDTIDLWNLQAQQMLGLPDWIWRKSEAIDPPGTVLVTGGVYGERYKSGPRKGQVNLDKPTPGTERTIVLTVETRARFAEEWEQSTGVCSACFGARGGDVSRAGVRGWQACKRCSGTGAAVKAHVVMINGGAFRCLHCGAKEPPTLPMPADVYTFWCKRFTRAHSSCKPADGVA